MRIFDAEETLMEDLKQEGKVVVAKASDDFQVTAVRHPTLGKLVLIQRRDGGGMVVEAEE